MDKLSIIGWANIKLLALDCDGVMTPPYIDTGVIVSVEDGNTSGHKPFRFVIESARFSHRDGRGIDLVRKVGVEVVVVTSQRSEYVDVRCAKLGVPCIKSDDKLTALTAWIADNRPDIGLADVCYVGDDTADLSLLRVVGAPITVPDAEESVKKAALHVTMRAGGNGAVREVCDFILTAKEGVAS